MPRADVDKLRVLCLGLQTYGTTATAMRAFTDSRTPDTPDELWLLEHDPVFTLGQAGRREHVHSSGHIPVDQSDRGGQVTDHGPGQLIVYCLLDLKRRRIGVRTLVQTMEQAVIKLCAEAGIGADRRRGAPGVYVGGRKLAALGLRVRRGLSYHGLAVNVNMDLTPFSAIDPCGYRGLEVTQLAELGVNWSVAETGRRLATQFQALLGVCKQTTARHTSPTPLADDSS
ncbi:MAG: lipoyl(octanoyl) transferase [Gammaproteobacteria bacterium]|nr:MAG: lipoyl(octanoyl) transferase [Gammaproteobacteria bacterium]